MGAVLRRWSFGCTTCDGRGRFRAASGTRLRRGSGECSQSGWAKSRGVARRRACPQVVKMPTEPPASVRCSSSASHWGGWPLAAGSRRQGVARFLAAVASTSILRVSTRPRRTRSMRSTPNHIVLWFSAAAGRSCGSMRRRTRRLCLCAPRPRRLSADIEPLRVLFSSGRSNPIRAASSLGIWQFGMRRPTRSGRRRRPWHMLRLLSTTRARRCGSSGNDWRGSARTPRRSCGCARLPPPQVYALSQRERAPPIHTYLADSHHTSTNLIDSARAPRATPPCADPTYVKFAAVHRACFRCT
mmetsp:Transcript_30250/g.94919  ORF Transcript_30250/g.94919 Transcript_30250/m.94919 type:complete len:300 (-) Transcript_30250:39-938(-)